MKTDATVVKNMQTTCALLAAIAGQYRIDIRQLKAMDLDWLAKRVKCWRKDTEGHLDLFATRLLYAESDPKYSVGVVTGTDDLGAFFDRALGQAMDAFTQLCAFRVQAFETRADGVTDLYEHAIQDLEKQIFKIEREQALLAKLGQPGYIGSRLEDG